jgi:hypothetical protein
VDIVKESGVRNTVINGLLEAENVITEYYIKSFICYKMHIMVEVTIVHQMAQQEITLNTDRKKAIWIGTIMY